jgi:hypothetical protein
MSHAGTDLRGVTADYFISDILYRSPQHQLRENKKNKMARCGHMLVVSCVLPDIYF